MKSISLPKDDSFYIETFVNNRMSYEDALKLMPKNKIIFECSPDMENYTVFNVSKRHTKQHLLINVHLKEGVIRAWKENNNGKIKNWEAKCLRKK